MVLNREEQTGGPVCLLIGTNRLIDDPRFSCSGEPRAWAGIDLVYDFANSKAHKSDVYGEITEKPTATTYSVPPMILNSR